MITAENFREKEKERINTLSDKISQHIQDVLAEKLKEEHIQVPFILHLDRFCFYNDSIVKKIFNIIGFDVINFSTSSENLIVTIDYVKVSETSNNDSAKYIQKRNQNRDIIDSLARKIYMNP